MHLFFLKTMFSLISFIGKGLSFIPRNRNYVVFLGHQGYFNGNAKYIFEGCQETLGVDFSIKNSINFLFIVRKGLKLYKKEGPCYSQLEIVNKPDWIKYVYYMWRAKVVVITTPGYDWKIRRLFSAGSSIILVSNGIPLKSPGILSKNFDSVKKLKYISYWSDIDQIWVNSQFERYAASSSLKFPIERVRIVGAARQKIFSSNEHCQKKEKARKLLNLISDGVTTNKKIVLVALTQRAYTKDGEYGALESISKLLNYDRECLLSQLSKNNIHLIVREHFLTNGKSKDTLEGMCSYIGADILPELNDIILAFDVVVTDYSGLYLDILKLDIKIGLLRFPGDEFIANRGLILPDNILSGPLKIESMESFVDLLKSKKTSNDIKRFRDSLSNLFFEVEFNKCLDSNLKALKKEIKL
jgi:CDP-glycerol glycerophosphotransferase (TagB/SpsB family)